MTDLFREKRYRYDEAIALGRTPEQAEKEVQEWVNSLTETTIQNEHGKTNIPNQN